MILQIQIQCPLNDRIQGDIAGTLTSWGTWADRLGAFP